VTATPPQDPVGPFTPVDEYDEGLGTALIELLREAPSRLREAIAGLTETQLDTKYKNWTIRQIVHHLADSHVHSYIRFKWALAEPNPTIKAYEEADWVLLSDAQHGIIEPSLLLFEGLHAKFVQLLLSMTPEQFDRTFVHPQTGETVQLWTALNYYPWHSRHHTGQILWLCDQHDW
jgi:uncharacterized damage-inducible protein DinB